MKTLKGISGLKLPNLRWIQQSFSPYHYFPSANGMLSNQDWLILDNIMEKIEAEIVFLY